MQPDTGVVTIESPTACGHAYVGKGLCDPPLGVRMFDGHTGDNAGTVQERTDRCAAACLSKRTPLEYGPWSSKGDALGFAVDEGNGGRCYCNHVKFASCQQKFPTYKSYEFRKCETTVAWSGTIVGGIENGKWKVPVYEFAPRTLASAGVGQHTPATTTAPKVRVHAFVRMIDACGPWRLSWPGPGGGSGWDGVGRGGRRWVGWCGRRALASVHRATGNERHDLTVHHRHRGAEHVCARARLRAFVRFAWALAFELHPCMIH